MSVFRLAQCVLFSVGLLSSYTVKDNFVLFGGNFCLHSKCDWMRFGWTLKTLSKKMCQKSWFGVYIRIKRITRRTRVIVFYADRRKDERSDVKKLVVSSRLRLKCDGTRAETRFCLSAKRTSPFKSAGASVQSTTGSRAVRISGSNAGYTKFGGSEEYWIPTPLASFPFTYTTVRHRVPSRFNWTLPARARLIIWEHDRLYRAFSQSVWYL